MMTFIRSIIIFITLSILFFACHKVDDSPISASDMFDCHQKKTWDSLSVKTNLIGEWEWEYISCYSNPENGSFEEFKDLNIEFKSDNTLDVMENGQLTQTSNWKVINDGTALDIDPTVIQLFGQTFICEDRVVFNLSFIDGCDNYFKRKE